MSKLLMIFLVSGILSSQNSFAAGAYSEMFPRSSRSLNCSPGDRNPFKCLVCSIYFESKGSTAEQRKDQVDTGRTMLTRLMDERYPDTLCKVVWQGHERGSIRKGCQFSWACDGKTDFIPGGKILAEVIESAKEAVIQGPNKYVNFYANWMGNPGWKCRSKERKTKHTFCHLGYEPRGREGLLFLTEVMRNLEDVLALVGDQVPHPTPRPQLLKEQKPSIGPMVDNLDADKEDLEIQDALDGEKI